VFGRRPKSAEPETLEDSAKVEGKGRPTPTRKEAEAARKQRLSTPRTRKQQAARSREQQRDARSKVRTAMNTGDDKFLPERDKGPVKRYVRDYVDSHRTIGEFLLPVFFVVFVIIIAAPALAGIGNFLWILIIALMVLDSVRIATGLKKGIRDRFGDDETKGVTMYALMRAWQMRRLRLPKPQVSRGDTV
jgi:hypothetical protein